MAVTTNKKVQPQALRTASCVCTAAKTSYNDSANAVKLMDAGSNGSIVYGVGAMPRATVTATQLQLYISPDNGTTMFFINSELMGAYTMAQTTQAPRSPFKDYGESTPRRLKIGDSLWAGIGVALTGGIVFDAQAEDL